ncbi:cysteine--1-D-myo-inosityl 2-amino-2-deoxy-alpha-D-glucopyranoside ligase [Allobranchiibius sp. GilTou73]|uniref:cysteine--1-D-myo-inosityl 2-amino-2-deoxy-alpha-D-glucopyranoside ligase n=1 Tax=Allobranchiibius sp. GilTou73 TaxID=2904523 RepID=UPI001F24E213|nr:cysteine--1-D-myo-inosityl 2-amino-2-deoxy-alpha-D-glucopyranoside ligase [Allobranchiibius sp. GilTou73]UIJ33930.1 cysteine--1-D-myo-inosityl 2-amino-2-deoxy-alpha-D-glucopyranoside ligase [Allobranchiibius sp. GilTou73]
MKSWPSPKIPTTEGSGQDLRLHNPVTGALDTVELRDDTARMYVCGITPYDATHLGHAATYVTFDLAARVWLDAGRQVLYVQNVTDIDDPLLERAARDGIDWRDLAHREVSLFQDDMTALRVLAPDHFVSVVETMPRHVDVVSRLLASGAAYTVAIPEGDGALDGAADVYLDVSQQSSFGDVSGWDRAQMMSVFADRGGDPDRAGKRDQLDPLLWRGAREGEPSWDGGAVGPGRPGWHVECTTIALDHLGMGFELQGGGTDLRFPHHEMSAVQAVALTGDKPFAEHYARQAMVGYDGEKMSKSKGNLVRVSELTRAGHDPMAVRLVLLDQHYRTEWEYTPELLAAAEQRLERWRAAVTRGADEGAEVLVDGIRRALCDDLDAPRALQLIDEWCTAATADGASPAVARAIDALLGIAL